MTPTQDRLQSTGRDLASAQAYLAAAQLAGISQLTRSQHAGGHLVLYPHMTLAAYYQWQIEKAQREVDRLTRLVRLERVQDRLFWRWLRRVEKCAAGAPRSREPYPWMSPMGMDEVIAGRRIVDRG